MRSPLRSPPRRPPASAGTASALARLVIVAAAAILLTVPLPAEDVERAYAGGLYPALQPHVTGLSNLLPIAVLDLLVAAAACGLVWRAWIRLRPARSRLRGLAAFLADVAVLAAAVYVAFVLLWGLHYQRRPAVERFDVRTERVTADRLAEVSDLAAARLNALYDEPDARAGLELEALAVRLQPPFTRALARIGQPWQPAPGRPKASLIAQAFPIAAVDGMMNPLALEVLLNPEVLPFERPFLLAHEWAHLAGHARESEASFVAFIACLEGDRAMQYSGWMTAALHAARSLPGGRAALTARLDAGPRRDVAAIARRLERASPLVYRPAWRIYDRYLRTHRVESGVANYGEVLTLILGSELIAADLDGSSMPGAEAP